jgi:hypothetical protein
MVRAKRQGAGRSDKGRGEVTRGLSLYSLTNTDSSRWAFGYDTLGQVTSGKRYWSDGTNVAGQQFEYLFDDVGNRLSASSGGDQTGANLRVQAYTANNLNQYTQRTVPGYVDVFGTATNTSTVTVNQQSTYRHGDYYRAELILDGLTASDLIGSNIGYKGKAKYTPTMR